MAKQLPNIYYSGFKQDFITQFVKTHKRTHPYFLKIDIAKFYPSINHQHLMVETQLAYKNLLGMRSVPTSFKKEFLPKVHCFFNSLPTQTQGIPLNSAFSKAIAPLIYVPFF